MIDSFILWFEAMPSMLQVFWACAIVSSLFFAVQVVLMLVGIDGTDADFDTDTLDLGGGFSLLTVKNVINFFLGLGWAGVSLWNVVENKILLVGLSLLAGVAFVILFVFLVKKMLKLESNGSYKPEDCVGTLADVYIPVPGEREGRGKVQLSINGSVLEFDAMTDGVRLPTGCKVRVTELLNSHTVVVEKI